MKPCRFIPLAVTCCCLLSCETSVFPGNGSSDPQLCVNAQFLSCDSLHTVVLCISDTDGLTPLPSEAEVTLRINGVLSGETESVYTEKLILQCQKLKASFRAGDTVELEVRCGGLFAHSKTVVPQAPVIEHVDTVFNKETSKYLCTMNFRDTPGEDNYYMVLDNLGICGLKGPDGVVVHTTVRSSAGKVDGEDPVFIQDRARLPESIAEILGYEDNGYRWIFTDHLFRDGMYSLHYTLSPGSIGYDSGKELEGVRFDELYAEKTVLFRLGSLSQDFYRFYSFIDTIESGTDPLATPISCPCNISGGTGYFGIVSVAEHPVRLPDEFLGYNVGF